MEKMNKKIGIVGSGKMGMQLGILMGINEYTVLIYSRNAENAKEKFIRDYIEKFEESKFKSLLQSITFTQKLTDLDQSQLIIECIKEDIVAKREVIKDLLSKTDSLIASCTSSFKLRDLTQNLSSNGRVNIIHFSNPVSVMKLAEVVYSPNISLENIAVIELLFKVINYKIFIVPDISGFVINSIIFQMLHKSVLLHVEESIATNDIDNLMKFGCGFPMGPFEIIKLIGPDTVILIFNNLDFHLSVDAIKFIHSMTISK